MSDIILTVFPCCFGAWFVEVSCRGPAYVPWGYLENVICIRNDIIRFLCIFVPKLARVLFFVLPFQLLHWYFNRLTWRFSPSYIFLAFEVHLSQKNQQTNKRDNLLFVLAKSGYFAIFFLSSLKMLNFLHFENFWPFFGQIFCLNLHLRFQKFSI